MLEDIVVTGSFAHPPERVWRAIASPDGLRAWLMENDLAEVAEGQRFRFRDKPRPFWDGVCDCTIVEADAPRRFALDWGTNVKGGPTRASWTFTATATGTDVEFRHTGLAGFMGWMMKKGMTRGWERMMARSIPYVLGALEAEGRVPTRDEVRAAANKA